GSSIGISKVKDPAELGAAVSQARAYSPVVIAEQGIAGEEYTASVLGDDVFPLVRIVPPGEFYDYDAKYVSDDTRYDCPTGLPDDLEQALYEQALAAFRALDVSGWGRVDFLLDEQQRPWFMEVNTTPGMTSHSLMPKAAAQVGIDFDTLVWRILETSL
ncbi:MAG: D-alanine--D-alanine ligase, partial [Xanthomonadales bacterium]|nr:D-alanine--D-alanine ligase [Xanthomonadales bacterium]